LPLTGRIEPAPLLIAGLFGFLVATAFTLWPLAQIRNVSASTLFRHRVLGVTARPGLLETGGVAIALALMVALAYVGFEDRRITTIYLSGLVASFAILLGLAYFIVRLAAQLPRPANPVW